VFPPKHCLLFKYKTHTTNVSVVREVAFANRQDTRRLRFSFFLQRCQTAGKLLLSLRFMQPTKNPPVPLSGNTGVSASCTLNSRRNVGSCLQRRVPQWPLYRRARVEVSSVCWKIFADAKKRWIIWIWHVAQHAELCALPTEKIIFDRPVQVSSANSSPGKTRKHIPESGAAISP
jgi:hypothetical protein